MNSSYTDLIQMVENKHEVMDGLEQIMITYLNICLDEMFNMSDVFITFIKEIFNKFAQDGISK